MRMIMAATPAGRTLYLTVHDDGHDRQSYPVL